MPLPKAVGVWKIRLSWTHIKWKERKNWEQFKRTSQKEKKKSKETIVTHSSWIEKNEENSENVHHTYRTTTENNHRTIQPLWLQPWKQAISQQNQKKERKRDITKCGQPHRNIFKKNHFQSTNTTINRPFDFSCDGTLIFQGIFIFIDILAGGWFEKYSFSWNGLLEMLHLLWRLLAKGKLLSFIFSRF